MSIKQAEAGQSQGHSIAIGSEIYNQVLQHYYSEALLLDHMKMEEWGATLAEDLRYSVPVKQTKPVRDSGSSVVRSVMHMDENFRSIMGRIMRLAGNSAWAEDPPSRLRRFVSNVQVFETDVANEFSVINYLLITRNRFDDDFFDLIPCERRDILRKQGSEFKLVQREALIDQALLGTPNLAIFL